MIKTESAFDNNVWAYRVWGCKLNIHRGSRPSIPVIYSSGLAFIVNGSMCLSLWLGKHAKKL